MEDVLSGSVSARSKNAAFANLFLASQDKFTSWWSEDGVNEAHRYGKFRKEGQAFGRKRKLEMLLDRAIETEEKTDFPLKQIEKVISLVEDQIAMNDYSKKVETVKKGNTSREVDAFRPLRASTIYMLFDKRVIVHASTFLEKASSFAAGNCTGKVHLFRIRADQAKSRSSEGMKRFLAENDRKTLVILQFDKLVSCGPSLASIINYEDAFSFAADVDTGTELCSCRLDSDTCERKHSICRIIKERKIGKVYVHCNIKKTMIQRLASYFQHRKVDFVINKGLKGNAPASRKRSRNSYSSIQIGRAHV
mgnify:CR=1 FL=1